MLSNILDPRPDLQHFLFIRGFLITNGDLPLPDKDYTGSPDHGITESRITPIPDDGQPTTDNRQPTTDNRQQTTDNRQPTTAHYPFYGHWSTTSIGPFHFHLHNLQTLYTFTRGDRTFFLIGHAYNPFTMEHEEIPILEKIAEACDDGPSGYTGAVDELTGLFITGYISGGDITFLLDCSGMQYGCYGEIGQQVYIASHMQLIGDICRLGMDPFVKKLIRYRWYKYMMGNYLPGELTAFTPVRRIIPNTLVRYAGNGFEVVRFYPRKAINMCATREEYDQVIGEASEIMKNNMLLITRKWKRPAISLTGGIDSNTTFAAANGVYDRYRTFSYVSMFRESIDAEAAKQISDRFNVPHSVYQVPDTNEVLPDFEIYKRILSHNDGDIGPTKDNDTRKKIVLMQNDVGDVEVKSWISETIRAYAYKYFGRSTMPRDLKPRHYTSLYKIFFLNRRLVWKTDRYFIDYLRNTRLKEHLFNYDESDFFVWEMMHGGKCGLNIGTMKFCFDITIPYNNRKFLDLVLRVPLKERISDQHHLDMKKLMNPELYDMNIRVVNLNETKNRKRMANIYFVVNSALPF